MVQAHVRIKTAPRNGFVGFVGDPSGLLRGRKSGATPWPQPTLTSLLSPFVPIVLIVPIVPGADGPLLPPAFLEDEDGEGSEWGWSDWDAADAWDCPDIRGCIEGT